MSGKREKALLFCSREICYSSGNFFAHQLGWAFEEMGLGAEIIEFTAEDDLDAKLKPLLDEKYRVVVDFNSLLPRMELEDGTRYLDKLDGPFFDYILDHPLFHYTGLTSGVKNLHAIVLDEAQAEYVVSYYPKISDVHMLPLGATKALYDGAKESECRILFPGTYDSPNAVYELVTAAPEPLQGMMKRLIERRITNPLIPMEEAFCEELADADMELAPEQFALFMNSMYPVDAYVRDYFRKEALDRLLAAGIPVTIMGMGWEKYHYVNEHSLRREPGMPFGLSFERIAKAHILLNVSPIFNRGMHDRIPAGMANHAVVLTDENPYLASQFTDGREISFYTMNCLDTLAEQAERLIGNASLRAEIAERAFLEFEERHTWKCRAKQILAWADEIVNKNT